MASITILKEVDNVMKQDVVRKQFEQHMLTVGYHQNQLRRNDNNSKQYLSSTITLMWYGWCAAIASKEMEIV